jgi:hypothetical protein
MNLSSIRATVEKLQAQAAERAARGAVPLTIVVLPTNAHEPDADADKPLPRATWISDRAVCIVYEGEQPDAETIGRLIEGAR